LVGSRRSREAKTQSLVFHCVRPKIVVFYCLVVSTSVVVLVYRDRSRRNRYRDTKYIYRYVLVAKAEKKWLRKVLRNFGFWVCVCVRGCCVGYRILSQHEFYLHLLKRPSSTCIPQMLFAWRQSYNLRFILKFQRIKSIFLISYYYFYFINYCLQHRLTFFLKIIIKN
jgi:hypothetical protein